MTQLLRHFVLYVGIVGKELSKLALIPKLALDSKAQFGDIVRMYRPFLTGAERYTYVGAVLSVWCG
jgi:hypothetical protein